MNDNNSAIVYSSQEENYYFSKNGATSVVRTISNIRENIYDTIIKSTHVYKVTDYEKSKYIKIYDEKTPVVNGTVPSTVSVLTSSNRTVKKFKPVKIHMRKPFINPDNANIVKVRTKPSLICLPCQPTNIKYDKPMAFISDISKNHLTKQKNSFPSVTTNVKDITEIDISVGNNYESFSIIVQKNNYFEIKISDKVIDVIGLSSEMKWERGCIKGTFMKSGEYNVNLIYPNGTQTINIIVPYYQRLL